MLSVDVGGTKIRLVEYDETYSLRREAVIPSDQIFFRSGEHDLRRLFEQVSQFSESTTYDGLGISFNCALKDHVITYSSILGGGAGLDLKEISRQYVKYRRFNSDNDVYCMAKAELKLGAGRTFNNFAYVNLGTGIRLVSVNDGEIARGRSGLAGEISPMQVWSDVDGGYVSADELLAGKGVRRLSRVITGVERSAEQVFKDDDRLVIDPYVRVLGKFLYDMSMFYNPEAIVFGGSFVNSAAQWLPDLEREYFSHSPNLFHATTLITSEVQHPASLGAVLE